MRFVKVSLISLWLVLIPALTQASQWAKIYGENFNYSIASIQQTSDGGFVGAGNAATIDATQGGVWVFKLDSSGHVQWQKEYFGNNPSDSAKSVQSTPDGGYIVAGHTSSFGNGQAKAWILKLDSVGNVQWQKIYGGTGGEEAKSILPTSDGGYVVAGGTSSFGAGNGDVWIFKLDSNGNFIWQKTYGSAEKGEAADVIRQTSDGGYIVAGDSATTFSLSSITSLNHLITESGPDGVLVLKLNANGNVQWQKVYGGAISITNDIQQTTDGGYIVAGYTFSYGQGSSDAWILKLNSSGEIQWQKTYGTKGSDSANSIALTSDGGYLIAGSINWSSLSDFGHVSPVQGQGAWVCKIDQNGTIQWQKSYGFPADMANAIQQTSDGDYVVAGSYGWVFKIDSNGNIPGCSLVSTSNAVTADTNVNAYITDLIIQNSSAIHSDSSATMSDLNSKTTNACIVGNIVPSSAKIAYSYSPAFYPSLDSSPSLAEPLAVGLIAYDLPRSQILSLRVGLLPFLSPVDIYGAYRTNSNPEIINVINPNLSFTKVTVAEIQQALASGVVPEGVVPWRANTTGPVDEEPLGDMQNFIIPSGTYSLYLVVTPAGRTDSYYLWQTSFTKQ